MTLREVRPDDEPALRTFLNGLCAQARRLRFFTGAADLTGAAHVAATPAGGRRLSLIAHDELGMIVGHALYVQLDDTRAEVALAVADRLHDRGLGTILVERLATSAEGHGITHFVAEVLPENQGMLDVFRDGFDAHVSLRGATDKVEFPTAAWRTAKERFPEPPASDGPAAR
ncbi:MAG TPA: GNAT family N-acetyltransferase [Solirubrobacteraceae bacterium]|nr:GNAT family N-acetyltransferase [Solirubrobacteraceae bacterium]